MLCGLFIVTNRQHTGQILAWSPRLKIGMPVTDVLTVFRAPPPIVVGEVDWFCEYFSIVVAELCWCLSLYEIAAIARFSGLVLLH
jgi:hypothetical protein